MHLRILAFACGASLAAAQPVSLTLDDAIRLAWANDPSTASFVLLPEVARAREIQAGIRPNPELEARGSSLLNGEGEWSLGLGVSQRLPRRERVELERTLARLGAEPAQFRLLDHRRKLAGEVRRLFYELAVQEARLAAAGRLRDAQSESLASLERRQAAGEVPGMDVAMLRIEVLRAEQAAAVAHAEAEALRERLRRRLRLPAEQAPGFIARLDALLGPTEPGPFPGHPAIALADWAVREAEAALALARGSSRQDWAVGAGVEFERRANDATGRLESDAALTVSASLPWPRRVANRGEILEKQAAVRLAEANARAVRDEVQAEIAAALAAAGALHPVLARFRDTLAAADELPAHLRAAFERGEVSGAQLAQARQLWFGIENEFLAAAARYLAARAEAETAAGLMPSQP